MSLRHEEFFALAIDPDEAPDPGLVPAIEEHRASCAECRELERDYASLVKLAKSMWFRLPPVSPGHKERVMAAAREVFAQGSRGSSATT
ncbi:MAG TPA: hypothetical protein VFF73_21825 [Planctomycetota bacterium]|nr:hypothetical protein [Planctomycetota bacterium]